MYKSLQKSSENFFLQFNNVNFYLICFSGLCIVQIGCEVQNVHNEPDFDLNNKESASYVIITHLYKQNHPFNECEMCHIHATCVVLTWCPHPCCHVLLVVKKWAVPPTPSWACFVPYPTSQLEAHHLMTQPLPPMQRYFLQTHWS